MVSDDPVNVGPFRLRLVTQKVLDDIDVITVRMLSYTRHTPAEQNGFVDNFRRDAEKLLAGNVIVELEVVADFEHAHEVFIEKATMLMDLLQVSTTVAEWCATARVGLRGGPHSGTHSAWVLALNSGAWGQKHKLTGGVGEIVLDTTNLTLIKRAGILRLAESLGRKTSPLEDALLRAAHWFAQSTLHDNASQGTFCLVVCLEAVLGCSSGPVVAERVARLIGKTQTEKRHLYNLVRDAYNVRNIVVHEGRVKQGFSRRQEFRRTVLEFIATCIYLCDEVTTPECLNRRIEDMRFS